MQWATPLSIFISKIHRPPSKITGAEYERALNTIKDGDVLLSRDDWAFSNLAIPGFWKHAAVYYSGYVFEAVTHGVRKIRFDEWMYKKDYVGITRPQYVFEPEEVNRGVEFLNLCIGDNDQYDFTMSMGDVVGKGVDLGAIKNWYCSKYCYGFYKSMDSKFTDEFTIRETLGEPTVTPQDYWDATSKFVHVASFNIF